MDKQNKQLLGALSRGRIGKLFEIQRGPTTVSEYESPKCHWFAGKAEIRFKSQARRPA
jgi:hypothetical protein